MERAGDETKDVIRMADMKENNMNDGVPSLDETAAEAVRLSVGPRPGAGPEKPRKDRRRIIIGAAAVAVAVLVAGGVCAHRAYESHQASVARDACESAVADQAKAVKAYKTLLGSDATVAALKTDAKSVKDAKTVDTLKRAAAVRLPAMVKCDASKAADLDAAAAKANKAADVKSDTKALETAAKAVESSKLDKTVAVADALYKATDGKVQDDKTRDALKQAIAKRDAAAIAKAVKSVNDSKTAKEKADAEAKAKAEQEAAAAAALPSPRSRRRHRNPKHIQAADHTRTAATRIRALLGWFHILAGAIQWQRRFVCRFRLRPAHRHRRQRRSRPERAMQTRKHLHGWRLQHLPVSQYGRSDGFSAGRPNVQTGMPAIGFQWSRMGRNRIPVRDH